MEREKTIEVLNSLIIINNDRIEGYETASKETEEQYLKTLFGRFAATSRKCEQELINEVNNLDGQVAEGTLTSGKFYRVWMDIKTALTGKDSKAILNSCEYGEDVAVGIYKNALKNDSEYLSQHQQSLIKEQRKRLKEDHKTVKIIRNALISA